MKKIVLLLAILMLASFAMSSCGEPSASAGNTPPGVGNSESQSGSGYSVVIDSYSISGDVVRIKFVFTNNSNKSTSFAKEMNAVAYQNGIALEEYYYARKDILTEVKNGASITVEHGFVLRDQTSDLEIELKEWSYGKDIIATKTFKIAK